MDIFDSRSARPMLVGEVEEPFDSPDHIYELKMDGERCLAYLDEETLLINRRNRRILPQFPELAQLHEQVDGKCILDGEIIMGVGSKEDFEYIKQRSATKSPMAISRQSREHPATFVAVDILYQDGRDLTRLPLLERLEILHHSVREGNALALSRTIPKNGVAFFERIKNLGLEGIIAKRLDSPYRMGVRNSDWLKIKNWLEDDFVVVGFMIGEKRAAVASLILGQYGKDGLVYKGRVIIGLRRNEFSRIRAESRLDTQPFPVPPPREIAHAIWLQPRLVARVGFMCWTGDRHLRQPFYKGLVDRPAHEVRETVPERIPELDSASIQAAF